MKKLLLLSFLLLTTTMILSACGKKPQPKACTEEAKVCRDGSAVGRTGPNCEFAPCPKRVKIAPLVN